MKIATVTLKSISPYSQSRAHEAEKLSRELPDDYEKRTWREKCHADDAGHVLIPPMAFKLGLDKASSMLSMQIPGRGKATYTKFFVSGTLVTEPLVLPVKKVEVAPVRVHCNADGKRGSGSRVWRIFPVVEQWQGKVTFTVMADEVTKDVFERVIKQFGSFVGVGRFRPENGGYFGRFVVEKLQWTEA